MPKISRKINTEKCLKIEKKMKIKLVKDLKSNSLHQRYFWKVFDAIFSQFNHKMIKFSSKCCWKKLIQPYFCQNCINYKSFDWKLKSIQTTFCYFFLQMTKFHFLSSFEVFYFMILGHFSRKNLFGKLYIVRFIRLESMYGICFRQFEEFKWNFITNFDCMIRVGGKWDAKELTQIFSRKININLSRN